MALKPSLQDITIDQPMLSVESSNINLTRNTETCSLYSSSNESALKF